MPKISVLMPVYNAEEYVADAISSILEQTFSDFEFIIINDGSRDKTAAIVKSFKDERIKFIDNPKNQGLIVVLNQGLDLCRGEYIARMDADDISYPERFAKQIDFLDNHLDVGLLGTAGENFGDNNDRHYQPEDVDVIDLLRGVCFYHPSVMIRRSVLIDNGLKYNKNYYLVEDYELWARMLKVCRLCNLNEILIKYRVHAKSV